MNGRTLDSSIRSPVLKLKTSHKAGARNLPCGLSYSFDGPQRLGRRQDLQALQPCSSFVPQYSKSAPPTHEYYKIHKKTMDGLIQPKRYKDLETRLLDLILNTTTFITPNYPPQDSLHKSTQLFNIPSLPIAIHRTKRLHLKKWQSLRSSVS